MRRFLECQSHKHPEATANRIGSAVYSPAELKTIQVVITLVLFAGFTAVYFREPLNLTRERASS